jgi:CRISPR-associated protein Cas2
MANQGIYIAAYDVTCDRERDRVAKILEGFGMRLQKSVFECRLTRSGKERLLRRVEELQLDTGYLLLVRTDAAAKRHHVGQVPPLLHREEDFAFTLALPTATPDHASA